MKIFGKDCPQPLANISGQTLEELMELDAILLDQVWGPQEWRSLHSLPSFYLSHKELKAFALWQWAQGGDFVHLLKIGVDFPFRRQGLAKKICEEARDFFAHYGVHRMVLEVAGENHKAKALYQSLGMKKIKDQVRPSGVPEECWEWVFRA